MSLFKDEDFVALKQAESGGHHLQLQFMIFTHKNTDKSIGFVCITNHDINMDDISFNYTGLEPDDFDQEQEAYHRWIPNAPQPDERSDWKFDILLQQGHIDKEGDTWVQQIAHHHF